MEYSLGQFGREGIVSVWKVCPLFEGELVILAYSHHMPEVFENEFTS